MSTLQRLAWNRPDWWTMILCAAAWASLVTRAIVAHEVVHWLLMIAAMMLPVQLVVVRSVAFNSLRRRRHIAIATFLAGYLGVWLVAFLPVPLVRRLVSGSEAAAAAFVLAAIWSFSRAHAWALEACHATRPLAPSGWRATRDVFRYGAFIGGVCVLACFPLMVACTLANHSIVALVGGGIVVLLERRRFRPGARTAAATVIGALAAWQVVLTAAR